jgi:2-oxo-3-hexenedioate decarboxylase
MTLDTAEALATELHTARVNRTPVAPLALRVDGFDRGGAYAVQAAGLELRRADGETVVGGKLGFTSRAMQRAMNVPSPNYGWLTDAMLVDDGVVRLAELIHPKVEPEIAFLLDHDLVPPVTTTTVLAATAAVLPCLEVVDSRYVDFRFGPLDNIADDSSAGRIVLGDPVAWAGIDLDLVGCTLRVDGEVVATAAGAAALDHPAAAVAWMANHADVPLRAGHVVISGGLTAPPALVAGMVVEAEFDRLGTVRFRVE